MREPLTDADFQSHPGGRLRSRISFGSATRRRKSLRDLTEPPPPAVTYFKNPTFLHGRRKASSLTEPDKNHIVLCFSAECI